MAEHHHEEEEGPKGGDSLIDRYRRGSTAMVYRLFGWEHPVHNVLVVGKRIRRYPVATVIWILFELLQYHLLTLFCHILFLTLAILFLWSNVNAFINNPPRIPDVCIPENPSLEFASVLTDEIHKTFALLREIASGRDLKKFLMAIAGFWLISVVGSWCNFLTFLYIVFVLLHTVPVLYEKHQDKVNPLAEKASIELKKHYAVLDKKLLSKIPRGPLKDKRA